jgi:hypothetical protein
MTTLTADFELERFTWADGAFEVTGRWRAPEAGPVARPKLLVEADGRRRRLGVKPPGVVEASPDGIQWSGRFTHSKRPNPDLAAVLEVGQELSFELPAPEMPSAAPAAGELDEAKALLVELRKEREAAERALAALNAARTSAPVPRIEPLTPRRAEIHRALERPREPRSVLEGRDPQATQKLVYAAAAALGVFLVILLLLIL